MMLLNKIQKTQSSGVKVLIYKKRGESSFDSIIFNEKMKLVTDEF